MWNVLVLGKIHADGIARLSEPGTFRPIERPDNASDRMEQARDADAIIVRTTRVDRALLDNAPRLKLVARHGVGYDAVDVAALTEKRIPLALVGDVNSTAVAEHTLGLMLALAKHIASYDRAIRAGNFAARDSFSARELAGRTILIFGFGRIGRQVARLCRAFNMTVVVFDPFLTAADVEAQGCRAVADFREALSEADFVSLHAPKLPDTQYLIGRSELAQMKRGGWLINVSRGGMVDEQALVEAVQSGHLSGAALDVFESEPLPADHPLAREERIVLSPHSAAFTDECARRMAVACAENVIACAAGRLDPSLVVNGEVLGRMAAAV
jgi:D-3-phosphoglycerate dehydrogenase / 2-oxoglutarate reductase